MVKSNFNQFMKETQKEIEKLQDKQKLEAKKIVLGAYNKILDESPVDKSLYKHSHEITVNKKGKDLSNKKVEEKIPVGEVEAKISSELGTIANLKFKDGDNIYIQNRLSYSTAIENGASKQHPPLLYERTTRYAEKLIKKAKL